MSLADRSHIFCSQNTSHSEIDRYIHRYAGVDCALAPIARALGSPNSIKDILTVLRTSVPINGDHASLEEASVGYGAALAFRRLVLASAPHRMGSMRIALQGLGTVGATLSVVSFCDSFFMLFLTSL